MKFSRYARRERRGQASTRLRYLFALVAAAATITAAAFAGGATVQADEGDGNAHGQHAEKKERPCKDEFREVPGQGRSCRVEGGLWKVILQDGSTILTHGPDGPEASGRSGRISPNVVARQPVCGGSNDMRAIIAVPNDVTGDKTVEAFRQDIKLMNGIFYHAAVESGSPNGADFRFLCDTVGQIKVDVVRLPTSTSNDSWTTIVSDVKAKGYNKTNEKYVVHYDARMAACGQGSIDTESTDSATNGNNAGPDFAINYDCDFETLLHETGHNLGAVQPGAPFATGLQRDANGVVTKRLALLGVPGHHVLQRRRRHGSRLHR